MLWMYKDFDLYGEYKPYLMDDDAAAYDLVDSNARHKRNDKFKDVFRPATTDEYCYPIVTESLMKNSSNIDFSKYVGIRTVNTRIWG